MNYNFFKLKNGLRVILVDTKTFPTLTAMLLVGAGSRFETKNNNGIAHFFEHMAFKGSKKYPNAMILSSLVEGIGGLFNAFTSKDHTGYWIKGQATHFETIIDVLADMIQHPLLKEDEIEREKGVIIEEINMYEDQPQYKVWELFEELIYPSHPLGYPIAGKKETVSQFNRQTFLDYINRLYYPENLILVVAGGLGQAKNYIKIIEEKFGCWQKTGENQFLKFKEDQKKPRKLIFKKKTEQAHLVLGYPGLNYTDPERLTQSVLMTILGGGMSSRLFYELRERRGLCYYVSSGVEPFVDTGYIYTRAGLTLNVDKIQEAIKIIIDEHQKLAEKQVDE
ncbi:MAG: M16 family metallopeptidase, partial [Microgenomates group bacterium]